jgi:5'-3' exonuclease
LTSPVSSDPLSLPLLFLLFSFLFSFSSHLTSSQSHLYHQQIITRFTRFISQKSPHDSQSYIYKNHHTNHSRRFTKSQQKSHVLHKINTKIITKSTQVHKIAKSSRPLRRRLPDSRAVRRPSQHPRLARRPPAYRPLPVPCKADRERCGRREE